MANEIEITIADAEAMKGPLNLVLRRDDLADLLLFEIGGLAREVARVCEEYEKDVAPIRTKHAKRLDDGTLVKPKNPETGELVDGLSFDADGWAALQEAEHGIRQRTVAIRGRRIPLSALQRDGKVPPATDEVKTPHYSEDGVKEKGVYDVKEVVRASGGQIITALMPVLEMDLEE